MKSLYIIQNLNTYFIPIVLKSINKSNKEFSLNILIIISMIAIFFINFIFIDKINSMVIPFFIMGMFINQNKYVIKYTRMRRFKMFTIKNIKLNYTEIIVFGTLILIIFGDSARGRS